jgi:hypothetical protein
MKLIHPHLDFKPWKIWVLVKSFLWLCYDLDLIVGVIVKSALLAEIVGSNTIWFKPENIKLELLLLR